MKLLSRIIRVLTHPRKIGVRFMLFTSNFWKDDAKYLKYLFYYKMGYKLNLECPQTYNEKLQWLKIYDRNPLYTDLVDKLKVKEYVTNILGPEYVIPTISFGWEKAEDIDWDTLPNQFVLKTTHAGGNEGIVVCKNKELLNKKKATSLLKNSLERDLSQCFREWTYKNVKRQIFAEQYMEDEFGELRDYKFFCFNGKVKALFIASDRSKANEPTKFDFYDRNFTHLNIINGHPMASQYITKPANFDEMIEIAEKLALGIPHVRVDLYNIKGKIYFGEYTFYHHSGLCPMEPLEWDYKFGSWLNLPINIK